MRFVVCLTMCHFVLVFFSPFSIAISSLGEERAYLSAFRTFVRFVIVWICRFTLPLGAWEGLRFVIVALPGLFSYLFFLLLKLYISSNEICNTAYALLRIHEQNSICKLYHNGPNDPNDPKGNEILFLLRFYGPVNPMGPCRAWSVYLTTRLLGRLSSLSG